MISKDIENIHDVGRVMALYYTDKEELFSYIKKGAIPKDEDL